MLVVISPAKTLDFDAPYPSSKTTRPRMLQSAEKLVTELRHYSSDDLQKLMGISEKLANLNVERYQNWRPPFNKSNAKAAMFAFQGDVYVGLDAMQFDAEALDYAQQHLRILSGLYGVLRPLDLIQAYRLEMGSSLPAAGAANLYEFWDDAITKSINKDLAALKSQTLINLASNEYFGAIKPDKLKAEIITPVFKDYKNGKYKILSFFAKKARGMLTAHIINNQLQDPNEIKQARIDGYRFSAKESDEHKWVFLRKTAPG
ncbi:MAG: peroxide stress protein YaaA [Gammaproteobacteria bacterium]